MLKSSKSFNTRSNLELNNIISVQAAVISDLLVQSYNLHHDLVLSKDEICEFTMKLVDIKEFLVRANKIKDMPCEFSQLVDECFFDLV